MATTIDALVITLGLDPKQFTEGQREALEAFKRTQDAAVAGGKNIEAQGKKAGEYFSQLKREALGLLAVVAGGKGIVDMTNHIINLDASTGRLARSTGIVAANLAKWQIAAREVGGTDEDARSSVRGVARSLAESAFTQNWDPQLVAVFSRLGLDRSEYGDPDKVLTALGKLGQSPEMQAHPERFAPMALRIPGMTEGFMNLFLDPRYKDLMSNAEKLTPAGGGLGGVSEKTQTSLALFSVAVENFSRAILDKFAPAIDRLTALIPSWLKPNGDVDFDKANEDLGQLSKQGLDQISGALVGAGTSGIKSSFKDNVPRGVVEFLMGPKTADEIYGSGGAPAPAPGRRGHGNAFAPGETITGIQIYSDTAIGAPAATGSSSTKVDRSSRSTSKTDVTIRNINLPGVKDAQQFVGSLDDVLSLQSHGAALNGGPR